MKEILNLKHKYKNLVFHEGIPHQEIIFEIRKYDFGLNVHTTDLASNLNSKMQWEGMGTKIFTYIEASLPVIVMKDSRGMSNFLKKHGLGFALKNNELKNLYDLIMNKSFINLKKNIIYFNNNLNFENYNAVTIKKIVNFVSSKN